MVVDASEAASLTALDAAEAVAAACEAACDATCEADGVPFSIAADLRPAILRGDLLVASGEPSDSLSLAKVKRDGRNQRWTLPERVEGDRAS